MQTYSYELLRKLQQRMDSSFSIKVLVILAIAFCYFITGWFGRLVALQPGFASAFWPPSGIALAAVMLLGYSVWPGIFLGSFIHNILIFPIPETFEGWIFTLLTAAGPPIGAPLQACLGGYWLKETLKTQSPFGSTKNVFIFIAVALVSPLINSNIGPLFLYFGQALPAGSYLQTQWTWWVGDVCGILVFTPLIIAWIYHPIRNWSKSKCLEAAAILGLAMLIILIIDTLQIPLIYLFVPLIIWSLFRFQLAGAMMLVALSSSPIAWGEAVNIGVIKGLSINQELIVIDLYIGVVTAMTLFLEAALRMRSEAEEELKMSNQRLEITVEERTLDLQHRLSQIQMLQKHLNDREKFAYLGELATGLAFEIQNPLNEIEALTQTSLKEIKELRLLKVDIPKLDAIQNSLERMLEHSKKAEQFIQGIAEHSLEQPDHFLTVDLNNLCEEYLKALTHDVSTTDNWFDVHIQMDLDPTVGTINAIPQDINIVLFNLLSNANHSVHEKRKKLGTSYLPKILISTQNQGNKVALTIRDNGEGISPEIREKLFTPFLSTGPNGHGLGLGLLTTHEIVVDKHRGELKVDSKLGEYTEIKVILPRSQPIKLTLE